MSLLFKLHMDLHTLTRDHYSQSGADLGFLDRGFKFAKWGWGRIDHFASIFSKFMKIK